MGTDKLKDDFLNGKCASFALAAHQIFNKPIYIAKVETEDGLGTHAFIYDEKTKMGFDAGGYFDPHQDPKIILIRKISPSILRVLNELHLHIINLEDVELAERYIAENYF